MPTGITMHLEQRDMGFAEFLWRCARLMGGLMHMRDDRSDARPYPPTGSDHYARAFADAQKKLMDVCTMTPDQMNAAAVAEHRDLVASRASIVAHAVQFNERLDKLFVSVAAWDPPTAEHAGLKKAMTEQINISREFVSDLPEIPEQPSTGTEWQRRTLRGVVDDLIRYEMGLVEEEKRNASNRSWFDALVASVPIPDVFVEGGA